MAACGYSFSQYEAAAEDAGEAVTSANKAGGPLRGAYDGDSDRLEARYEQYEAAYEEFWTLQQDLLALNRRIEELWENPPHDMPAEGQAKLLGEWSAEAISLAERSEASRARADELEQELIEEVGSQDAVGLIEDWLAAEAAAELARGNVEGMSVALRGIPVPMGTTELYNEWYAMLDGTHPRLLALNGERADANQTLRAMQKATADHCAPPPEMEPGVSPESDGSQ